MSLALLQGLPWQTAVSSTRHPFFAPPTPSPSPDTPVAEVFETSMDVVSIILTCLMGAIAILVVSQVLGFALRRFGKKHRASRYLERRSRLPGFFFSIVLGATLGWTWSTAKLSGGWYDFVTHGLLIVNILTVTWWLMSLCGVLEDMTRKSLNDSQPNRLVTQAQVLHRVLQVFFGFFGVIAVALTFPEARAAMGSVLASAGIISLVAGIAAQGVLANMFAGVQIAFSDSIRVGDVVVVQNQQGTIEEITLTYVVVHLWDERRLIMPSKKFTEDVFENWTKGDTKLLGVVEINVDWRLPLPAFRNEVDRLLANTDLWDGRTANVQVTSTDADTMLVRLVASASNSGDLWDLRCYMRERLLDWLQSEAPYALPRKRIETDEITEVELPVDEIAIEQEARARAIASAHGKNMQKKTSAAARSKKNLQDTDVNGEPILDQYARKLMERRRSWRIKAQRLDRANRENLASGTPVSSPGELDATKVLSTTVSSDRLFSGTPDAEERRRLLAGPKRSNEEKSAETTSEKKSAPSVSGKSKKDASPAAQDVSKDTSAKKTAEDKS